MFDKIQMIMISKRAFQTTAYHDWINLFYENYDNLLVFLKKCVNETEKN